MAVGKKVMELLFKVSAKKAKDDIKEVGDGLKKVGIGGKLAQGGLNLMSRGFKGIGVAIKAAGIGLFIGLLSQLTGLFQQNQKTTDTFQRIMIKLKPVFDAVGKVIEYVAGVLEFLIDLFTGAIGWIGKLIGVTNGATSASDDFANSLVEQRKQVKLLEAELALLQLQYQKEAELMRQIRDDESLSIEERIKANYELGKVLEEQLRHERSIAERSLALAEMELSINQDNNELQVAVINAKKDLAEIDERITGQRSEQLTNLNSLEREREAQQKEAADKRQEQLEKEAEMLQNLIDLQNEDIKVKKEATRTINEQFKNAEEANKMQIDELKKRMQTELNAHKTRVNNARENIALQEEEIEVQKTSIQQNIEENEKRAKSEKHLVKERMAQIRAMFDDSDIERFVGKFAEDSEQALDELLNRNVTSLEEMDKFQKDFTNIMGNVANETKELQHSTYGVVYEATLEITKNIGGLLVNHQSDLQRQLENTSDFIEENSLAIIEMSEQSAQQSAEIVENAKATELSIIEKYTKLIEETEQSGIETIETLQKQADDELFLHFETAQEKEIRLATEKYDHLLGLAQNNAEQTKLLEEEKAAVLLEINEREEKEKQKIMLKSFFEFRKEMKKQAELKKKEAEADAKFEKEQQMKTLQMGIGLAKEGTAAYKALASTETIISTYAGATRAFKDVPSPFNFIQAGLIIAAGVKNLAEINKTKVDGGGGDTGSITDTIGAGGDMGGDVPELPTIGAVGFDAPPVQAYVVETDISNAQALQSELDLQSTL